MSIESHDALRSPIGEFRELVRDPTQPSSLLVTFTVKRGCKFVIEDAFAIPRLLPRGRSAL